jgi:hypothetical protein
VRPGDASQKVERMLLFNETAHNIALKEHAEWIDVQQTFQEHQSEVGWYDDYHYDEAGHKYVANELAKRFSAR